MNTFFAHCTFILGVAGLEQLPVADRPEIAFAGRSNVGKSSLINAITNRKSLARTSHTPGRTQQLNFFELGEVGVNSIYMVDMPGYGYAKVSKSQRDEWTALIRDYLRGRPNLRCVFILIDSRHGLKDSDTELMKMLDEAGVHYRIVLTKTDKVKDGALKKVTQDIETTLAKHAAAFPNPHPTSAHKGGGVEDLKEIIFNFHHS